MRTACIYHKDCPDGFASYAVVRINHPEVIDYPCDYPDRDFLLDSIKEEAILKFDIIYVVDFSFTPEQFNKLMELCDKIVWIDHHKKAIDECFEWHERSESYFFKSNMPSILETSGKLQFDYFISFDNTECGAVLTYKYFTSYYEKNIPLFLQYIQGRDLWKKLPHNDEFSLALSSYGYTDDALHFYMKCIEETKNIKNWFESKIINNMITIEGPTLKRFMDLKYKDLLNNVYDIEFGLLNDDYAKVYKAGVVNAPYFMASDICNLMLLEDKEIDFAVCWQRADDNVRYSLRSRRDSDVDVNIIANLFKGGGHVNASGFSLHVDNPANNIFNPKDDGVLKTESANDYAD